MGCCVIVEPEKTVRTLKKAVENTITPRPPLPGELVLEARTLEDDEKLGEIGIMPYGHLHYIFGLLNAAFAMQDSYDFNRVWRVTVRPCDRGAFVEKHTGIWAGLLRDVQGGEAGEISEIESVDH